MQSKQNTKIYKNILTHILIRYFVYRKEIINRIPLNNLFITFIFIITII